MAEKKEWIDEATENAHGQFAAEAKRRGISTKQFAKMVVKNPGKYSPMMRKRASLALTLMGFGK